MQLEYEYILAVYRGGSFTKAAEMMHVTQPAMSMAIKKIENSVGMALFDRSTRPLELTDAGRAYMEGILEIIILEHEINDKIHDLQDLKTGNLHIGGSHFINTCVLPDVMSEYSKKYPGINLKLSEASSASLAEMLNENLIDITFSCRDDIIELFGYRSAFKDHILLAVSPETLNLDCALSAEDIIAGKHLELFCPCIPYDEMAFLEYVILSEGNNLHDRAMMIFNEIGFTPKIKLEISQLSTSYHLARSNFGAAFVSDKMITAGEDRLKFYKMDVPYTEREFFSVLPKRDYVSKAVRAFIDLVSEKYKP